MNYFRQLLSPSLAFNPIQTSVRHFERRHFVRRYGMTEKFHTKGELPRVKGDKHTLFTVPHEPKPDVWRPKMALFGQNDYIDILGDGQIHPARLLTHVPLWLRGFKGNEMHMLIRKRVLKKHWKWLRPHKWNELNKRIDYLYKYLNYKSRPPQAPYPWRQVYYLSKRYSDY